MEASHWLRGGVMNANRLPMRHLMIDVLAGASMKKQIAVLISLALFLAGCVSIAELPERINIQAPLPQDIRSVVIQAMPMRPGTIKNVENLTDAPQLFARYVKDALALKRPGWQIKLADEESAMPDRDIIITTELLEIDGGSAALRFWIGLTTGATQSTIAVSVLDKTGNNLATGKISERTICPVGACVESNEDTVRRNLQSLARDVAEFIMDPAEYEKKKGSTS